MYYGFDIGGTKIEFAVYDQSFQQTVKQRTATPVHDYSLLLETLVSQVQEADQRNGSFGTVGITLPGVLNAETGKLVASNLPCADGRTLAKDLADILERPVAIENDCKSFTLSEANGGAADKFQRVFGAILGTGAGGSFCHEGKIFYGMNNAAGEWGHMPISAPIQQKYQLPLLPCGCGLKGCYDRYVPGPGLVRLYGFFGGDDLSAIDIIQRYRAGEDIALQAFKALTDITASAFAHLIVTFDPEVIVIGGGLSNVPELYQEITAALPEYLFRGLKAPLILPPKFGDASGVRGAAIIGSQKEYIQPGEEAKDKSLA